MIRSLNRYRKDNRGVAAIEIAFIMPFLLFLYFGLIDLTAMISLNRKVTYSASVVADLVTQNANTVPAANVKSENIDDYFKAAALVMKPTPMTDVRVEIYAFRKVNGTPKNVWSKASSGGTGCGTPPTTGMANLMTDNNDIIVGVVCTTYSPYIATFLGKSVLGATSFTMNEQIALRPRQSPAINCTTCTRVN